MIITIQCKDSVGLVAKIANVLASVAVNIVSMREFVDTENENFFARFALEANNKENEIKAGLTQLLPAQAICHIHPQSHKKMVVLVSIEYHCLSDVLIRNHFGTLGADVLAVIGNHAPLADICQRFDVPFFCVSHEGLSKETFEEKLLEKLSEYTFDYLVLAKFMRILSPTFVAHYPNKIINIHHSFLPAFIGANPYKQAHTRGVKLIGATAHFVTNDLDEGPIIAQQTIAVNHTFTAKDMVKSGKEIETAVLIKALNWLFTDRVFVYNNKTVVFE